MRWLGAMGAPLVLLLCATTHADAASGAGPELDRVLRRAPDAQNGARLYETCAACHGSRGEGAQEGTVPAIGGQHFRYLAKALVDFRNGLRVDARMAHFSDTQHLAYSQEIADVAAYISRLNPPASAAGPGAARYQTAMLYTRSCERCHGASGEGKADLLVPRVASQHADYLVARLQVAVTQAGGTTMAVHAAIVSELPGDQLVAVAKYLAALEPATADR